MFTKRIELSRERQAVKVARPVQVMSFPVLSRPSVYLFLAEEEYLHGCTLAVFPDELCPDQSVPAFIRDDLPEARRRGT